MCVLIYLINYSSFFFWIHPSTAKDMYLFNIEIYRNFHYKK